MDNATPRIEQQDTPHGLTCAVLGVWTAAHLTAKAAWQAVNAQLSAADQPQHVRWNLLNIELLDHLGAQLLWTHWGRAWPEHIEIAPQQRALIETVEKFAGQQVVKRAGDFNAPLAVLGARTLSMLDHIKSLTRLIGQLLLDIMRLLRRPQEGPWRDLSGHLYHIGATALPITALVGFLIGVVLAYLMAQQLKQFGADTFIVNILGISLIRELGPVLAAVLIAGRSGSAITAQIGVMRVTEELDAMRVMGIARFSAGDAARYCAGRGDAADQRMDHRCRTAGRHAGRRRCAGHHAIVFHHRAARRR